MQYRFGNCRLDMASRQLLCEGVERSLTPDAFVAEANVAILVGDVRARDRRVLADGAVITLGSVEASLHALANDGQSTMTL